VTTAEQATGTGAHRGRVPRVGGGAVGYLLVAPAAVLMAVFLIAPTAAVVMMAVTDWSFGARSFDFVGLRNFAELWGDPRFQAALANTLIYVATVVPGTIMLGLAVALVIESTRRLRAFYRALYFLPVMATLAAMATAWEALLHPTIGPVARIFTDLGLAPVNWLNDPRFALATLCAIGIWQHLGFAMVLILAGLKSIPRDLYDAGAIDGVVTWYDRLHTITLPMLGPAMMFVTIVVALRAFEVFDTVQILTQGGPLYATETLVHTLYVESFEHFRSGYGAAVTLVFLVIVIALTLVQARVFDKRVHYT